MDPIYLWVLGAVGIILSVIFSIAIGALQSYSKMELESRIRSQKRKKRMLGLMERSDETLLSVKMLNVLSNVVVVIALTLLSAKWLEQGGREPGGWEHILGALVASLVFVLIVGEIIPSALARRKAEGVLKHLFPLFDACAGTVRPFTRVLNFILKVAMRIAGIREEENGEEEIEKDILEAVSEGEREGYIKEEDRSMIASILEFRDQEVSSVMTPRTEMVSIPDTTTLEEAIAVAKEKGPSRIPVHKGNRDAIIGVAYVKDILFEIAGSESKNKSITTIMRKPFFVPETKRISSLLNEFQQGKHHMAIVLDEYGGTAGLVTVEDIVEEIVGEIVDEYDVEEDFYLKKIDKSSLVAQGGVHLDDVNDQLGIELPEDQGFETVAGFLSHSMGRIPAKGEEYIFNGVSFSILEANERRIKKVKIVASEAETQKE